MYVCLERGHPLPNEVWECKEKYQAIQLARSLSAVYGGCKISQMQHGYIVHASHIYGIQAERAYG